MNRTRDPLLLATSSNPALNQLCDEIIERLQAGDGVDIASLAVEHPEHADQLRRLIPALEALVDLGASAAQDASLVVSKQGTSDLAPRVLGDYRIVREIGRGGMGVVYEAQQRSLNRRVALKVLPMAAALDARQFQRFQLEAQAAACLHHNNIVPVFAVGAEGGVPFYAMQFIEGRSLAEVIHELRRAEGLEHEAAVEGGGPEPGLADLSTTALARSLISGQTASPSTNCLGPNAPAEAFEPPATAVGRVEDPVPSERNPSKTASSTRTRDYCRNIARLGLQAAEALDHAHTRGILHRDIKPGNLLLDAESRLWVTDFGLAQIQGNHGLTLTGDILGTLRYMSPEQALARGVVIDGRTDVYSLGVTLYELLTLRPAFDGKDRAEILRKIGEDDPAPLRKVNASVPQDLETIIHTALAKEPSDRYATAKDLADDLRHYLEGRPIRARRPSLLDRAAKWGRRHTASVAAAIVIFVLAIVGLATSTVLIAREREQAVRQRDFARKAVDEMYSQFAEKWLADQPALTRVQKEFLEKALGFYQRFAAETATDPRSRRESVAAALRVGRIRRAMKQNVEAEAVLRPLVVRLTDLALKRSDEIEYARDLALARYELALVLKGAGRTADAVQLLRQALTTQQQLKTRNAEDAEARRQLAIIHQTLADLLREHDPSDQRHEALAASLAAVAEADSLVGDFPSVAAYRLERARANVRLGNSLRLGSRAHTAGEVENALWTSLDDLAVLEKECSRDVEYREVFAHAWSSMAIALLGRYQLSEAEDACRKAVEVLESLAAEFPDIPRLETNLSSNLNTLSIIYSQLGRLKESEEFLRKSIASAERTADRHPDTPDLRDRLGIRKNNLVVLLITQKEFVQARRLREQILVEQERLVNAYPQNHQYTSHYLRHLSEMCNFELEQGNHVAAARVAEALARRDLPETELHWGIPAEAGWLFTRCAFVAERDAASPPPRREEAAKSYLDRARVLWEDAFRRGPDAPKLLRLLAGMFATVEYKELRDPARALRLARRSVELEPESSTGWMSLALAEYRNDHTEAAIAAIKKSGELASGKNDLLFVGLITALTRAKTGDLAGAREALLGVERERQKAIAIRQPWSRMNRGRWELYVLYDEAAALLGVEPLPPWSPRYVTEPKPPSG